MNPNNKTNSRIIAIKEIKKKHANTLKDFSFLSDVIQIFCPPVFPDLPYRELTSLEDKISRPINNLNKKLI